MALACNQHPGLETSRRTRDHRRWNNWHYGQVEHDGQTCSAFRRIHRIGSLMFDFDHPFFDPLWRRIVIVALCFGWGAFEIWNGSLPWGMVFFGMGALAGYNFFFVRRD